MAVHCRRKRPAAENLLAVFWQIFFGGFFGALVGAVGSELGKRLFLPSAIKEAQRDRAVEICVSKIDQILEHSTSYWNAEFAAKSREIVAAETTIQSDLQSLSREINELLIGQDDDLKYTMTELRILRQACTGSNFGDEDPQPEKDRLVLIKNSAADLKRNLVKRRNKLRRNIF